jgi:hypothetical protein
MSEYKVISSLRHWELEKEVNMAMSDGWKLAGSMNQTTEVILIPPNNMSPSCAADLTWRSKTLTRYSQSMER